MLIPDPPDIATRPTPRHDTLTNATPHVARRLAAAAAAARDDATGQHGEVVIGARRDSTIGHQMSIPHSCAQLSQHRHRCDASL